MPSPAVRILLVEPQYAINLGLIARAMANFGFSDLGLVRPIADPKAGEAVMFAKKAHWILERARVYPSIREGALKDSVVVGTTAVERRFPNAVKEVLPLREALPLLKAERLTLVFGNEGVGLRERDIEECDMLVKIETSPQYPALNVANSVAILLYLLSSHDVPYTPARRESVEVLLKYYKALVERINAPEKAVVAFKRLLAKSKASQKEVGFLLKVIRRSYELLEGKP